MKIGMVGLGKMGANMTERLIEKGHQVVAFDLNAANGDAARLEALFDRFPSLDQNAALIGWKLAHLSAVSAPAIDSP